MNDQISIEGERVDCSGSNSQAEDLLSRSNDFEDYKEVFVIIDSIDIDDMEDTIQAETSERSVKETENEIIEFGNTLEREGYPKVLDKQGKPRKVAKESSNKKASDQSKENINSGTNFYNLRKRIPQGNNSSPNKTALVKELSEPILNKPSNTIGNEPNKDCFCWVCHKVATHVNCHNCVRSFHMECLKVATVPPENWTCRECIDAPHDKTEVNGTAGSSKRKEVKLTNMSQMLKYGLNKMLEHNGAQYFDKPVDKQMHPDYDNYIIKRMDLKTLMSNVKQNMYKDPEAFLADCKWILHNSVIYDFGEAKRTTAARSILKLCIEEIRKIKICEDCYLRTISWNDDTLFTEVCSKPHLPIWAKIKGYPYWPAKLIKGNLGMANVRFFGRHEYSRIPFKDCNLYDGKKPLNLYKGHLFSLIVESYKELDVYIDNLKQRFGSIYYLPVNTKYDPTTEEKFYSIMLPGYVTLSSPLLPSNETCDSSTNKEVKNSYNEKSRKRFMENCESKMSLGPLEIGDKTVKEIKVTNKGQKLVRKNFKLKKSENSSLNSERKFQRRRQTRSSSNPYKPITTTRARVYYLRKSKRNNKEGEGGFKKGNNKLSNNDQISISNTTAKPNPSTKSTCTPVHVPNTPVVPIENEETTVVSKPTLNSSWITTRRARKFLPRQEGKYIKMQAEYMRKLNNSQIQKDSQDKSACSNTSVNALEIGNKLIVNTSTESSHTEKTPDHSNNTSISREITTEELLPQELPSTSATLNETQIQINSRLTLDDDTSPLREPSELPEYLQTLPYSQGLPPEETNILRKLLQDNYVKMTDYFIKLMEETIYEMADEGSKDAMIRKLQLENELLKLRHAEEIKQLTQNIEIILSEARDAEAAKQVQQEKTVIDQEINKTDQAVDAVKHHLWSAPSTSSGFLE